MEEPTTSSIPSSPGLRILPARNVVQSQLTHILLYTLFKTWSMLRQESHIQHFQTRLTSAGNLRACPCESQRVKYVVYLKGKRALEQRSGIALMRHRLLRWPGSQNLLAAQARSEEPTHKRVKASVSLRQLGYVVWDFVRLPVHTSYKTSLHSSLV